MTVTSRPADTASPEAEAPLVRATAHTAGFADALGTRHLKFDHAAGASLEILRIRPDFGDSPAFEGALRARVDELRTVQHPSLATVHGVDRREGEGLCLVSRLTSGRRIAELAQKAQGATFALELLRLVTPALAMLHRTAGVAHGIISAERIVVTRDGRLVLVDHVFGRAIESLALPRPQLIELGLAVPAGADPIRFDGRTDMAQLGFVALSLLLGRPLDPADYPEKVPALLDEFVRGADSPFVSGRLRGWLERAMQISPRAFASAREAQDALGELPEDADVQVAASMAAPPPIKPAAAPSIAAAAPPKDRPVMPALRPAPPPIPPRTRELFVPLDDTVTGLVRERVGWLTPVLAVLAGVEAVVIAVLLFTRPAASPVAATPPAAPAAQSAAAVPAPAAVPPATVNSRDLPAAAAVETAAVPVKNDTAPVVSPPPAAPLAPRVGTVALTSPITLQVMEGGTLVGSTGEPFTLSEGQHNLEFVNEELGFRFQQPVSVRNGRTTPVNIGVPNGRVSINAVPWAEVTIDGNAAGETPIANLSLPIGTHEIVFRHPQLGERRQTVVVKVEGIVRVTQTLQSGLNR